MLLPDDQVPGLQVRKCDNWITVKPARHAFIVNIGDQIQVNNLQSLCYPYSQIFATLICHCMHYHAHLQRTQHM